MIMTQTYSLLLYRRLTKNSVFVWNARRFWNIHVKYEQCLQKVKSVGVLKSRVIYVIPIAHNIFMTSCVRIKDVTSFFRRRGLIKTTPSLKNTLFADDYWCHFVCVLQDVLMSRQLLLYSFIAKIHLLMTTSKTRNKEVICVFLRRCDNFWYSFYVKIATLECNKDFYNKGK